MKKIKIIIVDDHNLVREMLTQALSINPSFEICGSAGSSDTAFTLIREQQPDIILLDINLQPLNGFEMLPEIKKLSPNSKVIAVSLHETTQYAKKMIAAGASGYITKTAHFSEISNAIMQCIAGKQYLCNKIRDKFVEFVFGDKKDGVEKLTNREKEIIDFIKDGFSSKQISEQIHISTKTVEVHRYNILRKLNLKNAASLMDYAYQHCL